MARGKKMERVTDIEGRVLTPDKLAYLKKWDGYTKKQLRAEEHKWYEFAWLGRHLFLAQVGEVTIDKYPKAFVAQDRIIKTYENDKDFIRCFVFPESENGDEEWKEILWNLRSLRFLLCGEWNSDT